MKSMNPYWSSLPLMMVASVSWRVNSFLREARPRAGGDEHGVSRIDVDDDAAAAAGDLVELRRQRVVDDVVDAVEQRVGEFGVERVAKGLGDVRAPAHCALKKWFFRAPCSLW